jgi:hypothetical protein
MTYKTIKIFLASSLELKEDRREFEIFIARRNNQPLIQDFKLELVHWENFSDAMSATRKQDDYNQAISECDIFVSLFFSKAGRYTEEEFNIAWASFLLNDKPIIYTYIKNVPIIPTDVNHDESLTIFKQRLKSLGHFYTKYTDFNDLNQHFVGQLDRYIHGITQDAARSKDYLPIQNNNSFTHPQYQYLIAKTRRVVGRQFVYSAFKEFVDINPSGYFTIVGNPGEGKTTILSKFIIENQTRCAYYFIRLNVGQNKFTSFIETIYGQIKSKFRISSTFPDQHINNSSFLESLLHEVSSKLTRNEKFFVIIDALDEIDTIEQKMHQSEKTNLFYLPEVLPDNIYILLSRRRQDSLNRRLYFSNECKQSTLDLKDYSENCREDIRIYITLFLNDNTYQNLLKKWYEKQELSKQQFIELLCDKSENNFLYLSCVIPEIANGFYTNSDLIDLPQGLIKFYVQHWDRMFPHLYEDQLSNAQILKHKYQLRVIDYLAQSLSPISVKTIYKYAKNSFSNIIEYDIVLILNEWIQFLDVEVIQSEKYYTIYHTSFQAFLASHEDVSLTRDVLSSPMEVANADAARSIDKEISPYLNPKAYKLGLIDEKDYVNVINPTDVDSSRSELRKKNQILPQLGNLKNLIWYQSRVYSTRLLLLVATFLIVLLFMLR